MARKRTDEELADAPKEMPSEMEDKIYGKSGKKKNDGMIKKGPYIHKKMTKEQEAELRKKMMPKLEPDRPSGKMTPEEKRRYIQLANDRDPGADDRMKEFERTLREAGLDDSKMKDGGVARGRGNKIYQHNYATGGQVVDHLSKVVGPPQSVQAATATVGESPAERSKRLRSGG